MVVAAMQGADQHIRSCRPRELNQQPLDNRTLALPVIHNHPCAYNTGLRMTWMTENLH